MSLSDYDWETWNRNFNSIFGSDGVLNSCKAYSQELVKPNKEYTPSVQEIKEIIIALMNGHGLTLVDLRERPDDVINTISNFLKKLEKFSS